MASSSDALEALLPGFQALEPHQILETFNRIEPLGSLLVEIGAVLQWFEKARQVERAPLFGRANVALPIGDLLLRVRPVRESALDLLKCPEHRLPAAFVAFYATALQMYATGNDWMSYDIAVSGMLTLHKAVMVTHSWDQV
jgi:hypothetical protein